MIVVSFVIIAGFIVLIGGTRSSYCVVYLLLCCLCYFLNMCWSWLHHNPITTYHSDIYCSCIF